MLDKKLFKELQEYVEINLCKLELNVCKSAMYVEQNICEEIPNVDLEDYIRKNRKPTFSQVLFNFIDKKGAADSEIYKKAGIDRRHFSKIKSIPDYRISKNTAIAFAFALELNKNDIDKLLSAAGYSLSDCDTFDLVIQFCIERKVYDINNVNEALDYFSLKPLSGALE